MENYDKKFKSTQKSFYQYEPLKQLDFLSSSQNFIVYWQFSLLIPLVYLNLRW